LDDVTRAILIWKLFVSAGQMYYHCLIIFIWERTMLQSSHIFINIFVTNRYENAIEQDELVLGRTDRMKLMFSTVVYRHSCRMFWFDLNTNSDYNVAWICPYMCNTSLIYTILQFLNPVMRVGGWLRQLIIAQLSISVIVQKWLKSLSCQTHE